MFQSESTFYSCLNVKELLAQSRCNIWSLNDWNWTRTKNHLVHKGTLNHLAELAEWLSCSECLSVWCISLYVLITSPTRFRVLPHSVVAWMSKNSLLEKSWILKFKLLERVSNIQPLSSWGNTHPFIQTGQMIKLSFEFLSVRTIWLYVLIISRMHFGMNPHSTVAWLWRNCLLKTGAKAEL